MPISSLGGVGPVGRLDIRLLEGAWAVLQSVIFRIQVRLRKYAEMRDTPAWSFRTSRRMVLTSVLPLLWWALSLLAGVLGIRYDAVGDLIVTWNLIGAVGSILVVPAGAFALIGGSALHSSDQSRKGRILGTVGLALSMSFCLLACTSVLEAHRSPTARPDPTSWSPALSSNELLVVAVPYVIMLAVMAGAVVRLWRRESAVGGFGRC